MKEKTKEAMNKLLDDVDTACSDICDIYNATNKITIRLYEDEMPMSLVRIGYELSDLYYLCGQAVDRVRVLEKEAIAIRKAMEDD